MMVVLLYVKKNPVFVVQENRVNVKVIYFLKNTIFIDICGDGQLIIGEECDDGN